MPSEPTRRTPIPGPETTLGDMLSDPRNLVDSVVPALVFVAANDLLGMTTAAIAAGAWGLGAVIFRLLRKQQLRYAFGGLFGLAIALGFALRSGEASDYFLPGALLGFGTGLVLLATVPFKPLSIYILKAMQKLPEEFYRRPETLKAHRIVTAAWATWAFIRNGTKLYLVSRGAEWALAVVHTAAYAVTALLVIGTWAFLKRQAPEPDPAEAAV